MNAGALGYGARRWTPGSMGAWLVVARVLLGALTLISGTVLTVAAAVVVKVLGVILSVLLPLLGKSMWDLAPTEELYKPITNWVKNVPTVRWETYWAIRGPFSAGPIGDSPRARRARWRSCYRATATAELLGPQFPRMPAKAKAARNARVAGIRRARGALLLAAVVLLVVHVGLIPLIAPGRAPPIPE